MTDDDVVDGLVAMQEYILCERRSVGARGELLDANHSKVDFLVQ